MMLQNIERLLSSEEDIKCNHAKMTVRKVKMEALAEELRAANIDDGLPSSNLCQSRKFEGKTKEVEGRLLQNGSHVFGGKSRSNRGCSGAPDSP
jgi:hypothetical protein